ncbi:16S rRNA (uracil(1498)-N(3))-methyltransferase [Helicobacter equorum]|uniref:16S rRNA (uracil(1498)-N(3))-methyltransferase n=1 Tax=Helicobacter equorum TaxID=361872 RepID=UPI000CF1638F|nr:16S rRNA (uracil(1498)-N(3))-methyltransferase [Helicobacter equorum]
MRFVYHPNAKAPTLTLIGESYTHIFKARRHNKNTPLVLCNLLDNHLYTYQITHLDRNKASLELTHSTSYTPNTQHKTHIIWAIVDSKIVEKTLPTLNELGISKLTLFFAQYSQKPFSPNLQRLHKILTHSCEQCARGTLLELELLKDLDSVLLAYKDCVALEFGGEVLTHTNLIANLKNKSILIGPEGGFSPSERDKLPHTISVAGDLILRSESACVFVASMLKLL